MTAFSPDPRSGPFWSVMIPTYNRTTYLERSLSSVLGQAPGPEKMQIEVVDNASPTDEVERLVRRVGGDRVTFTRNPSNLGMYRNINRCVELARGQWVHILHDDDYVLPGFYARFENSLESRPNVGAAFCRHRFVDADDNIMGNSALECEAAGVLPDFVARIGSRQRIQFSSMVVRREVFECLGAFRLDLSYTGDWEMWIRIAAHYPIWYEPTVLAAYRTHPQAATADLKARGEAFDDVRRCIEVSKQWLPADRADKISRRAREFACLFELSSLSSDDALLRVAEELMVVAGREPVDRVGVAEALLRAATVHRRNGHWRRAGELTGRALRIRPLLAGRPLKRAAQSVLGLLH